jgi:hypothetical protein
VSVAEVGDQLAHRQSAGGLVQQSRALQIAYGGHAAVVVSADGLQVAVGRGHVGGARFALDLPLSERQQARHADVRVVADGHLLGLGDGEPRAGEGYGRRRSRHGRRRTDGHLREGCLASLGQQMHAGCAGQGWLLR